MQEHDAEKKLSQKEKISTGIDGFDKLFFGGIQLKNMEGDNTEKPLVIGIYGPKGTNKALLGMQLMHGLTKGIRANQPIEELNAPIFISRRNSKANLEDLLLDTLISKCTNQIVNDYISGSQLWNTNEFCSAIFDLDKANKNCIPYDGSLDWHLSQHSLYYNNRTNSLHIRKPGDMEGLDNLIAPRRYDTINEYCSDDIPKKFQNDFFKVAITDIGFLEGGFISEKGLRVPCIVLDGCSKRVDTDAEMYLKKKTPSVLILLAEDIDNVNSWNPDIVIELRVYQDPKVDYMYHQLRIHKSALQATAIGWHQYKKVDYGIEVYPSSHVILQRRRHMSRALLCTHSSVLSQTFQQYLDHKKLSSSDFYDPKLFADYLQNRKLRELESLNSLYISPQPEDSCYSILNKIFINEEKSDITEPIELVVPTVTAIIGSANTYKRYLTSGAIFSSCCNKQHVLNILLDKENAIMLRKTTCPVLAFDTLNESGHQGASFEDRTQGRHQLTECRKCYDYFHFMDIRMGCISSDEFFYYLIKQLEVPIKVGDDNSKKISRIVIDDLQKIDYSFPMLKNNPLFLTTLTAICKDHNVDLFILCDKDSEFAQELRAQADNVICTKRSHDNKMTFYIERYSGYNNPSRIFACSVKQIGKLFQCSTKNGKNKICFDENKIDGIESVCMNDFWVSNDIDKLVKYLANGTYE